MACPVLRFCVFLAFLLLQIFAYCTSASAQFRVIFNKPSPLNLTMYEKTELGFNIDGLPPDDVDTIQLKSSDGHIAEVLDGNVELVNSQYEGKFNISGVFLGKTNLFVRVNRKNNITEEGEDKMQVVVTRKTRIIDTAFTVSVATLVSILYINFGAALDLHVLKSILRRPIGPILGFLSQFLFMPLMSYALAILLFPDRHELQLGLFFTGVSPAGGASNIWTVVLGGNMNLSVAMTTISTFAAFGMMPLWIFTLGKQIFDKANLGVPYTKIATFAIGLVVPLGIGVLIQKKSPRMTRILVRILKPLSTILILFIVIFAIITNLYIFELFNWEIVVAGLALPWAGYLFGYIASKILRLPGEDAMAISIETGVQNTGIAIFLLRFALQQPEADLTTIVPVSIAIMTPFPLLSIWILQKIKARCGVSASRTVLEDKDRLQDEDAGNTTPIA